jgi:hypothetical protein
VRPNASVATQVSLKESTRWAPAESASDSKIAVGHRHVARGRSIVSCFFKVSSVWILDAFGFLKTPLWRGFLRTDQVCDRKAGVTTKIKPPGGRGALEIGGLLFKAPPCRPGHLRGSLASHGECCGSTAVAAALISAAAAEALLELDRLTIRQACDEGRLRWVSDLGRNRRGNTCASGAGVSRRICGAIRIAAPPPASSCPGGEWVRLGTGQSIGHKRIQGFTRQELAAVRLRFTKSIARPAICRLAVFDTSP